MAWDWEMCQYRAAVLRNLGRTAWEVGRKEEVVVGEEMVGGLEGRTYVWSRSYNAAC
jgi:hypothetical protein